MAEGKRGLKGVPLAQMLRYFSLLIGGRWQCKKQVREQFTHGTGEEDAHVNTHAWINAAQKPASRKPRQDNLFVALTVAVDGR